MNAINSCKSSGKNRGRVTAEFWNDWYYLLTAYVINSVNMTRKQKLP